MDVSTFVANATTRNEPIPASVVGNGVLGKILEVRGLKTPDFNGLIMTVKIKGTKYVHFLRYDGLDLVFTAQQLKENDTDEWLGRDLKFVAKPGMDKKGKAKKYVNVYSPAKKKATKKKAKR